MWLDELELEEENLKINGLDFIEAIFAMLYSKGIKTVQKEVLEQVMEDMKNNSKLSYMPLEVLPELGIEFFKNHIVYDDYKYNIRYEKEEVENILSKISDEVKQEIEEIILEYNKKRLLSLDEFVPFFLAALKQNTKLEKKLTKDEEKYVYLPHDYLETIIHILTNGNKWNEIFKNLIRIEKEDFLMIDYFGFNILEKMRSFSIDRHVTYCFYSECIMIEMSEEEKEEILSKYDKDTIHQMRWFADLVVDLPQVHAIQRNIELSKINDELYPQRKLVKKYEPKRLK